MFGILSVPQKKTGKNYFSRGLEDGTWLGGILVASLGSILHPIKLSAQLLVWDCGWAGGGRGGGGGGQGGGGLVHHKKHE